MQTGTYDITHLRGTGQPVCQFYLLPSVFSSPDVYSQNERIPEALRRARDSNPCALSRPSFSGRVPSANSVSPPCPAPQTRANRGALLRLRPEACRGRYALRGKYCGVSARGFEPTHEVANLTAHAASSPTRTVCNQHRDPKRFQEPPAGKRPGT